VARTAAVRSGTTESRYGAATHHWKGPVAKVDTVCSGMLRLKMRS